MEHIHDRHNRTVMLVYAQFPHKPNKHQHLVASHSLATAVMHEWLLAESRCSAADRQLMWSNRSHKSRDLNNHTVSSTVQWLFSRMFPSQDANSIKINPKRQFCGLMLILRSEEVPIWIYKYTQIQSSNNQFYSLHSMTSPLDGAYFHTLDLLATAGHWNSNLRWKFNNYKSPQASFFPASFFFASPL